MESVTYLGSVITSEGIKQDKTKVNKILEAKKPTTKKEVRSFLGLTGWFRKFIPHYAELSSPLTKYLEGPQRDARGRKTGGMKIELDDEAKTAFETLKTAITEAPILIHPKEGKELHLFVDGSGVGVGAVLTQDVEGDLRVIGYASKKIDRPQSYHA